MSHISARLPRCASPQREEIPALIQVYVAESVLFPTPKAQEYFFKMLLNKSLDAFVNSAQF